MVLATSDKPPLRDRRRAAVERIALDLALEHGYDAVTVEMICDAALVSPSTFFNYFGSKDRAVLGPEPPPLDEQRLAAFAAGRGDALSELMRLIVADWPDAPAEREVLLKRLDLTARTPASTGRASRSSRPRCAASAKGEPKIRPNGRRCSSP